LVGKDRTGGDAAGPLDGDQPKQVLPMAESVWEGQRASRRRREIPRDFWLEEWEKEAIVRFHLEHPRDGYRRLTYMMMDADVVAVSPSPARRDIGP